MKFKYNLMFGFIALMSLLNPLMAQNRVITGKVTTGTNKDAVIGAVITVKGTTLGTVSNASGDYSISMPSNSTTLVFNYAGLKKAEVVVSNQTVINVEMQDDPKGLDEVVVTAIGGQTSSKALGYSTQNVSGDEVKGSGEQNVIQGLASKAAGVYVQGTSGTPGASSKILFRGNISFTGNNQPLIVVDGLPISNETNNSVAGDYPFNMNLQGVNNSNRGFDINPDDIESINILKGPAAAALYGSQGAAGVIMITTKKGRVKGKSKGISASFGTSYEMQKVNKLPELNTLYGQGTGGGTIVNGTPKESGTFNASTPNSWGKKLNPDSAYDNLKDFFQTGNILTNSLVLNAFNEKSALRFSISNMKQEGIVPNSKYNRTTVTVNADQRVSDKINIGTSFSMVNAGGTFVQNGSNLAGVMLGLTRTPASYNLNDPTLGYTNTDGSQRSWFPLYDNPYWSVYNNPYTSDLNRMYGNFVANITPFKFMKLTYRLGTDVYTDKRLSIFSIGSNQPDNSPGGEINHNVITKRYVYQDIIATFKKSLTTDLDASLMVGNNIQYDKDQSQFMRGRDLTIPNFYNLSNASNLYADESYSILKKVGTFGQLNLTFKDMLFFEAAARQDLWSSFSEKILYPSTSLAFVFTELAKIPTMNFGKLRMAYAVSGNGPVPYRTRNYYSQPNFTDGFTSGLGFPYLGQNGFGVSTSINDPNLKPEKTIATELGAELKFLESRIRLDFTYYKQLSKDLILSVPLAPSSGYSFFYTNVGEMENKGIELVLSGTAIETKDFSWDIAVNFNKNKNEVKKLALGVEELAPEAAFTSNGAYAIVGQPFGVIYGTKWQRNSNGQLIIGANGLPLVDPLRGNIGNPYPDWMMGIRNSFDYKGIRLTALLDIRKGGEIWNGTYARLNRLGRTTESANRNQTYVIEGVKADGTPNDKAISANQYFTTFVGDGGNYASENAMQDGSWVRLRELGLSYNLKVKAIESYVKSFDIGVTAKNLWLKTDYKGVDPETSLTGAGSNVGGFDYFNNPGVKSWIFSVRANF